MIKGLALSLLGSSLAVAAATTLQVHHRIVHLSSDLEIPQFEHRGAIVDVLPQSPNQQASPSQSTSFRSDSGSVAKIEEWVDTWKDDPAYRSGEILYQVALQRKKDDTIDLWDVQSVRLCHLPIATSEAFVLHLAPSAKSEDDLVEWFSYDVHPVPRDNSCTLGKSGSKKAKKQPQVQALMNSTVELHDVRYTPKVALRPPTPMTSTGEPIQPRPWEKSFLQKYWVYILGAMIILAVATPPETEDSGSGDGGAASGAAGRR